ncbi:MAG: DUF6789 family protein [Pseudolabrys sp.]|jgi:Na+/proline symporter
MDFDHIWKSIAAGLCGSAAHSGLMALKSWLRILPTFQPYDNLQMLLTALVGNSVHPMVPWVLSFFNGSVVLGFLFGHFYQKLPGRTGVMKGVLFGFAVWIAMSLTFFPAIGKGLFAAQAGLGIAPTLFTLAMVLTYSVTLGVAYSLFTSQTRGRAT